MTLRRPLRGLIGLALCGGSLLAAGPAAETARLLEKAGVRAGLCVHLGCGDGEMMAGLAGSGGFLVHGLALDAAALEKTRAHLHQRNLYGLASAEMLPKDGAGAAAPLPYADNLVNLLIVEDAAQLRQAGVAPAELLRVLCPKGVLLAEAALREDLAAAGFERLQPVGGGRIMAVKPRPKEMDEWTHRNYDAHGNVVSQDRLAAPPNSIRWIAGPCFAKGPRKTSTLAALSAGGRNFYLTVNDTSNLTVPPTSEGRAAFRPKEERWFLMARDAFNGLYLWKQPVEKQAGKSAKPYAHRPPPPIVAAGDRVYAALKAGGVEILDAADGAVLRTCPLDSRPSELLTHEGTLYAATDRQACAIDPETAKVRWRHDAPAMDLVIGDDALFFFDAARKGFVALSLADGKEKWQVKSNHLKAPPEDSSGRPTLRPRFYRDGMLILAWRGQGKETGGVLGVSAKDGKPAWTHERNGEDGPFFLRGQVWVCGPGPQRGTHRWEGLDLATGKVVQTHDGGRLPGDCGPAVGAGETFHGRVRFGIGSLNLATWQFTEFRGARGPCTILLMPANGLTYTHTYSCGCAPETLKGYMGLCAAPRGKPDEKPPARAPEAGPAAGEKVTGPAEPDAWPTLRHDGARSAAASTTLPADLAPLWAAKIAAPATGPRAEDWNAGQLLGDPITPPTIAAGLALVAVPDRHQVRAVDAATGRPRWTFTAGGRVDSPPTYYDGLCLFGCRDGSVYCLRAADGVLVWRFRAAPRGKLIPVFGQLESAWPVSGSVLVAGGVVCFGAGLGHALADGFLVYGLDARTGNVLWRKETHGQEFFALTYLSAMIGEGDCAYLGDTRFNLKDGSLAPAGKEKPYLYPARYGLLDGQWRMLPSSIRRGQRAWKYGLASGTMLAFDAQRVYSFELCAGDRTMKLEAGAAVVDPGSTASGGWVFPIGGRFSACDRQLAAQPQQKGEKKTAPPPLWAFTCHSPVQAEAFLVAGQTLVIAGTPDYLARKEGFLWLVSAAEGKRQNEMRLDSPPVYDGLAAAYGRLYVSTQDGRLLCFGAKGEGGSSARQTASGLDPAHRLSFGAK